MKFSKINAIVLKSIGVDSVVRDGTHYSVEAITKDVQFSAMIFYVANCLSSITSQAYIVPFDVTKVAEQNTGYDVALIKRSDLDSFPVNMHSTPGHYMLVMAYIVEKMGVLNGKEINFDNLTQLFRELVQTIEPGQVLSSNPFSLMLISLTCPEFMRGMLPEFAPRLFVDHGPNSAPFNNADISGHENVNYFEDETNDVETANIFLSDNSQTYDNSDALGL